jgi:cell division cycle protein 20 (cofactor of APC complex)
METEEDGNHITSVKWGGGGAYLAIGLNDTQVQLWDGEACQQVRTMHGHEARVGSLAWNEHLLSSGSRDTTVINHDVRIANHNVNTIRCHEQEVCGLQWSGTGSQLASGGNDNLLSIWDAAAASQRFQFTQHEAAVKALAWCPFMPHVLASGGGTADRCIRFWNTQTGQLMHTVDTKSQVCSLLWSKKSKELVSSHGFSQNQLTLWKYPSMTKVTELTGHTSRVLHTAMSADGSTIVSAAADETLRFWKVFGDESDGKKKSGSAKAFQDSVRMIR